MLSLYAILKTVHILMAIIALGANLSYPLWLFVGHKNPAHLSFALKGIQKLDDVVANPAYILSLLSGLGLCWYLHLNPLHITWLWVSLLLFILAAVTGMAVYSPLLRKQIATLSKEGMGSKNYQSLNKKGLYTGIFIFLVALAIIFLMVAKPA
ncbi:Uncharacterized membrane protein [Arachidicoccus rhizosphaerae]|uniref:Uncharacterized membrane protein n=1 Tax=Arachidicoccus rhizosphaerae TaxID=551991 RepID=A0A1H3YWE3_9BACT|nr:DUF2269 family protein [Arachidicoccus rhizosphaerae]SEA15885.1 Uncharacterized membrane protein [Arachidicoccus rhizosphaerae]